MLLTCFKLFVSKLRVIAKTLFQNDPDHIQLSTVDILEPTEVRLNSYIVLIRQTTKKLITCSYQHRTSAMLSTCQMRNLLMKIGCKQPPREQLQRSTYVVCEEERGISMYFLSFSLPFPPSIYVAIPAPSSAMSKRFTPSPSHISSSQLSS